MPLNPNQPTNQPTTYIVFCILFITCVSIVIVLHSLYRAAVSALLSLVVLVIMLCEIACCTCTTVWANKEGRKDISRASEATAKRMKTCPHCQRRNCSPLNVLLSDRCIDCVDIARRSSAMGRQTTVRWQKQVVFIHTRLSRAYLALARLSCIHGQESAATCVIPPG